LNKTPICGFEHFNFVAKRFYVILTCSWGKSRVVMKLIYRAILRYKNCYVCVVRATGWEMAGVSEYEVYIHTYTHTHHYAEHLKSS